MKHWTMFAAGAATGALLMYFLDAANGGRRRALVRDKLVATGHDVARRAGRNARRVIDQARGIAATGNVDRTSRSEPASDRQLHERIRSRLGRLVSHPGAVRVQVNEGQVRLEGHILTRELDPLLQELRAMPGVRVLQNARQAHESAEHIPQLQGRETA